MNKNSSSELLVGSLVTSGLGGLLLLIGDFAGTTHRVLWYYADYGPVYRSAWDYINFSSYWWAALIIGGLAVGLFYCSYLSIVGLTSPKRLSYNNLRGGYIISIAVTLITLLAALVFVGYASGEEYPDWWLDTGFYAGLIGGSLTALFFKLSTKEVFPPPHTP
jgi:hypothetical protein